MIEGLENVCKADSARSTKIDCTKTIEEYIQAEDWRIKANANTGYSNAGLINNISGKIIANYWLDKVYSKAEGDAHRNGDYYIHDLDCLAPYCCGHDLAKLLNEGFNGVPSRVGSRPPKHLREALYQMANYIGILQAEWGGAQAFSSFDTYLAPYVFIDQVLNGLNYNDIKKAIRNFIYNLNVPSRWGQSPFSNCTIDYTVPRDLAEQYPKYNDGYLFEVIYNGLKDDKAELKTKFIEAIEDKLGIELCKEIKEDTNSIEEYHRELLQSLGYKHFANEMRLIVKAFYEVLNEGDEAGRPFTFPIPTVNITEDFDWDDENANLIFENAGKYGSSYFQNFIGSQYKRNPETGKLESDPNAYRPSDVRSMCCRLQLDKRELRKKGGGLFGADAQTGSIGVVTINMARLGYLYKGNEKLFYKKLTHLLDLAKSTLEKRRAFVKEMLNRGLYPYTKRYLRTFDTFFSTIGTNGMNEMIRNFTNDAYDITSKEGQKFALEVLTFIREKLKVYQELTGNLYNLEATPSEGACYRLAKTDLSKYPDIITAGTKENPYYTNSSQLPVGFTDDVFEALDLQDELQTSYTGGTVVHLYMSEPITNVKVVKQLVKSVLSNYRLPYISVSPSYASCPIHGYIPGHHKYCPKCDAELIQKHSNECDCSKDNK